MPESPSIAGESPTTNQGQGTRDAGFNTENLKQSAARTARETGEQFRDASEQIRQTAQTAAEEVKQQGAGFVQNRKTQAADQLNSFSAAIRGAADRLHEENDHNLAAYAEATAERVEGAARYLSDQDFSGIAGDVEQLARRQPELFLGGMFLAGLGISRFLKASRQANATGERNAAQAAPGYRVPEQYRGA